jgi:hypothetical protein
VAALLVWAGYFIYMIPTEKANQKKELFSNLQNTTQIKEQVISSFIHEKENDLIYLTNSAAVKYIFMTDMSKIPKETTDALLFFQETKKHRDVILINPFGKVVWSAAHKEMIGQDLSGTNQNIVLKQIFVHAKKDLGVGMYSPESKSLDTSGLPVYITNPVVVDSTTVTGKKETLGYIFLEEDTSLIQQLVMEDIGLPYSGEVYIVNRQKQNVTRLTDPISGSVDSEQIQNCFDAYDDYYVSKQGERVVSIPRSGSYKNYAGKSVLGSFSFILQSGWCVLAEVNQTSFIQGENKIINDKMNNQLKILLGIFITGIMITVITDELNIFQNRIEK